MMNTHLHSGLEWSAVIQRCVKPHLSCGTRKRSRNRAQFLLWLSVLLNLPSGALGQDAQPGALTTTLLSNCKARLRSRNLCGDDGAQCTAECITTFGSDRFLNNTCESVKGLANENDVLLELCSCNYLCDPVVCNVDVSFVCPTNNDCLPDSEVLDGIKDCPDGADEDPGLHDECELGVDQCPRDSGTCTNINGSTYRCSCKTPEYCGNGLICERCTSTLARILTTSTTVTTSLTTTSTTTTLTTSITTSTITTTTTATTTTAVTTTTTTTSTTTTVTSTVTTTPSTSTTTPTTSTTTFDMSAWANANSTTTTTTTVATSTTTPTTSTTTTTTTTTLTTVDPSTNSSDVYIRFYGTCFPQTLGESVQALSKRFTSIAPLYFSSGTANTSRETLQLSLAGLCPCPSGHVVDTNGTCKESDTVAVATKVMTICGKSAYLFANNTNVTSVTNSSDSHFSQITSILVAHMVSKFQEAAKDSATSQRMYETICIPPAATLRTIGGAITTTARFSCSEALGLNCSISEIVEDLGVGKTTSTTTTTTTSTTTTTTTTSTTTSSTTKSSTTSTTTTTTTTTKTQPFSTSTKRPLTTTAPTRSVTASKRTTSIGFVEVLIRRTTTKTRAFAAATLRG